MESNMFGSLPPSEVDDKQKKNIEMISDQNLWRTCENTIKNSLECFTKVG